jgi:hypothetical protein
MSQLKIFEFNGKSFITDLEVLWKKIFKAFLLLVQPGFKKVVSITGHQKLQAKSGVVLEVRLHISKGDLQHTRVESVPQNFISIKAIVVEDFELPINKTM